jgi:large subunit ribosomal protein L13e
LKYGRGFTLQELKAAKMGRTFARTVGISVDHRRINTNLETMQANIQRLESYKSKLILFPRKDGKYKKGDIADSTADKLKSAEAKQQNKDSHVLPKGDLKKREKPTKITKEVAGTKVYKQLRQERTNKKHQGMREKRAKLEAEKAK